MTRTRIMPLFALSDACVIPFFTHIPLTKWISAPSPAHSLVTVPLTKGTYAIIHLLHGSTSRDMSSLMRYPFATMHSQPSQSVSTSPLEHVFSSILSHASAIPAMLAVNHNPPPSSTDFSPTEPMPTTPPSHQRPTISSQAKRVVPSHYRPAANNQHSMGEHKLPQTQVRPYHHH
ncbi:LOW QUALITY PROTEIN: hypothetical protein V2J09_018198 [Rumex salicifolius]